MDALSSSGGRAPDAGEDALDFGFGAGDERAHGFDLRRLRVQLRHDALLLGQRGEGELADEEVAAGEGELLSDFCRRGAPSLTKNARRMLKSAG